MDKLTLKLLDYPYIEQIFEFEKENKTFFEKTSAPRPEAYNQLATLEPLVQSQIEEIEQGEYLMFLVFHEHELVGRMNVTHFAFEEGRGMTANLGYRFAEKHNGKGYATKAVALVKQYLKRANICQFLYGGAAIDNYGSQIVLVKNHFQFMTLYENVGLHRGPGNLYVDFGCPLD